MVSVKAIVLVPDAAQAYHLARGRGVGHATDVGSIMQNPIRKWWVLVLWAALFSAMQSVAHAQAPAAPVALKGYDPVAYFTEGKPVKGVPGNSLEFDDARYWFSSAKNKSAFVADPDKYSPQFAGFCSGGMAKGKKAESNPELWAVVNGKLYMFSSLKAKEEVLANPERIAEAHKNWANLR